MSLNVTNFLCYYQFDPFSSDLDRSKDCCPLIVKVALLWLFTAGLVPLICRIAFYDQHKYRIKTADEESKTNAVAQTVLKISTSSKASSTTSTTSAKALSATAIASISPDLLKILDKIPNEDESVVVPKPASPLISMELQEDHVLLKGLGIHNFIIEEPSVIPIDTAFNDAFLTKHGCKDKIFLHKSYDFHDEFYKTLIYTPIARWYLPQTSDIKDLLESLQEDPRKDLLSQLNAWDSTIHLRARLNRLKMLDISLNVPSPNTDELIPEWKRSYLRFAVMLKSELMSLKVADLSKIDQIEFYEAVSDRILKFAKERTQPIDLSQDISDLPLVDLPRLTLSQLYEYADQLPTLAFLFIQPKQMNEIDFEKIPVEARNWHFTPHFVQQLGLDVLYKYCDEFTNKQWLSLSDKQAINFDLTKISSEEKRVAAFKALFCNSRMQKLSQEKLKELTPYFSKGTWQYVSGEQAIHFDFARISDEGKRKEAFLWMFRGKRINLIPQLSTKALNDLANCFEKEHWLKLTDAQALNVDLTNIKDEARKTKVVKYLFAEGTRIKQMTLEQIQPLYKYFKDAHWEQITEKEIANFDFDDAEPEFIKVLFKPSLMGSRAKKFLPKLTASQVEAVKPHLDKDALKHLPKIK